MRKKLKPPPIWADLHCGRCDTWLGVSNVQAHGWRGWLFGFWARGLAASHVCPPAFQEAAEQAADDEPAPR